MLSHLKGHSGDLSDGSIGEGEDAVLTLRERETVRKGGKEREGGGGERETERERERERETGK